MGFLKRFWRSVSADTCAPSLSRRLGEMSREQLDAHLRMDRYGDFLLADAIRPSFDLAIIPRVGYRHDTFHDSGTSRDVPVLAAALSRDVLFEVFMELLDPLGDRVDVVLETSHDPQVDGHIDLYREEMDLVVLKSLLYDFEELLLKDGYTGIAVLRPDVPMEVQFDEHKLLFAYARDIEPFEQVLRSYKIPRDDRLKLISEAEHLHLTEERFIDQLEELKLRLGVVD